MLVYWLFLGFAAIMALFEQSAERANHRVNYVWVIYSLALAIFIGGRWKTGGDWGNYYNNLQEFYWLRLDAAAASSKDIGYTFLSIVASQFTTGIVVITMFTGIVMAYGLMIFCLKQPRPWLCMAVAFPYLVVVCGMGYIRQGIAISFILIGLVALERERVGRYVGWVTFGALFHATAFVLIPLGAIASRKNRLIIIAFVAMATVFAFRILIETRSAALVVNYVDADAESSGALVRAFMGALPASIFLIFRKQFGLSDVLLRAWMALSVAAILAVPAVLFYPSSTVIDRLGLYLLPLQCFLYSRVPDALAKNQQQRLLFTVGILLLYVTAFFTFMNFADHAAAWSPYRFYLFEDGLCLECGGSDRAY
jgi:hypothetical protein